MSKPDYKLSIPFTIPYGMSKDVLKLNVRYMLTTIHSFYRFGNTQETIIWTNSKFVRASVELYAFKSGFPISVVYEDFSDVVTRYAKDKSVNSHRVTNRLAQFIGVHEAMGDKPFLHCETDIVFLGKIDTFENDVQFWGKTWNRPVVVNELASDTHKLFGHLDMVLPKAEMQWANTGIYYSSTNLDEYIKEVASVLFASDISSVITNKPSEEIFQNLLIWRGGYNTDIDLTTDMNLVPSRIGANIPKCVQMTSIHYTHGSRPHTKSHRELADSMDDQSLKYAEIIALWHFLSAEMDEQYMDGSLQSKYSSKDILPMVEKFL